MPMGWKYVRFCSRKWSIGSSKVESRKWLSVGCMDVRLCRKKWSLGSIKMESRKRLSVGCVADWPWRSTLSRACSAMVWRKRLSIAWLTMTRSKIHGSDFIVDVLNEPNDPSPFLPNGPFNAPIYSVAFHRDHLSAAPHFKIKKVSPLVIDITLSWSKKVEIFMLHVCHTGQ